jgi:hypothetical protein
MSLMRIVDNSVPPGVYHATFDGVEQTHHEVYGDGLVFKFVVDRGRFKGRAVTRVTKPEATLKNSCGVFLAALAGKTPADGLEIDPADHEGRKYLCTVTAAKNGGSRVENFVREVVEGEPEVTGEVPFDVTAES